MSDTRRRAILEAARADPALVAELTPVVAASFGVLALRRLGDVLTVACFARANRQALRLLREVLGLEVVAAPFDDRLLHEAIRAAYFPGEEDTVNFPTFREPDFLEDPHSAAALRDEKVEQVGEVVDRLDRDLLALASATYRATLSNLDDEPLGQALPDPRRTRLDLGALEPGWQRRGGRDHVHLPAGLPDDARAVLTQYRLSEYRHLHGGGRVSEHHVATEVVRALPLVVHPSEVQLTQLGADGGLGLHVYDRLVWFPPGRSGRVELCYYFLSSGNRMRRRITLDLHELETVARSEVLVHHGPAPWRGVELGRWFGLPTLAPPSRTGA